MHAALPRDAIQSVEMLRNDPDAKVRFASGTGTGMSGVAGAFINDIELRRRQRFIQFPSNLVCDTHDLPLHALRRCQAFRFLVFSFSRSIIPFMGEAGYRPRFGKDIRIKPDVPVKSPAARPCGKRECEGEGTFRVPRSRDRLDEHLWFCLQHAREHNETWDYFRGMNEADIEAFRVDAVTGHRP